MANKSSGWRPVLISDGDPGRIASSLLARAPATVADAIDAAVDAVDDDTRPGAGSTADLWSALATVAAHDLEIARAIEPHWDAVAIFAEAGAASDDARRLGRSWGVFAAEGAEPRLAGENGAAGWSLSGVKPWCSLANTVDAALVTAWVGDARGLFAVALRQPGVVVDDSPWRGRGLVNIPSGPVTFTAVPAVPVGETGWYLERPGFAWGGIGVAACWYGGAVGLARSVLDSARRREPSVTVDMHLGAIDEVLTSSRLALQDAARRIDAGATPEPALLAKRVRGIVARACEEVLLRVGHALGPGPLATDAAHAQRVADLQLYIRQHHAERDQESLGRTLRSLGGEPW